MCKENEKCFRRPGAGNAQISHGDPARAVELVEAKNVRVA